MNPSLTGNCIRLLIARAGAGAKAQTAVPKTREQVKQELVEARRAGSMFFGEAALPMHQVNPVPCSQAPRQRFYFSLPQESS